MTATRARTVTIAQNETTSDAFHAEWHAAFEVQMPAAFTGTSISFLTCLDTSAASPVYQALYAYDTSLDDGSSTRLVQIAVAASRNIALPTELVTCQAFKIVSNQSEAAARSLVIGAKTP